MLPGGLELMARVVETALEKSVFKTSFFLKICKVNGVFNDL